jgi:hypothetical protein
MGRRLLVGMAVLWTASGACGPSASYPCDQGCSGAGSCYDAVVDLCSKLQCPYGLTVPTTCSDALKRDCSSTPDAEFIARFGNCFSSVEPPCASYQETVVG